MNVPPTILNLQLSFKADSQFFASQRTYGYVVLQENRHSAHETELRALKKGRQ